VFAVGGFGGLLASDYGLGTEVALLRFEKEKKNLGSPVRYGVSKRTGKLTKM
jgi:hypothetical protein